MGVGGRDDALTLTFRPEVPMGHFVAIPFACALAASEALGGRVSWPYGVTDANGLSLARVRARAGYDEQGVYATCDLLLDAASAAGEEGLETVANAVRERVKRWEADVRAGRAAAGPLAPFLGGYFDALEGMGGRVEVIRAGRVVARGTLAGVDVWGRATVSVDGGGQVEVAPEQAELRLSR